MGNRHMRLPNAFLHSPTLDKSLINYQEDIPPSQSDTCLKLKKSLYGTNPCTKALGRYTLKALATYGLSLINLIHAYSSNQE
jgi:hypothetical protein